MSRDPRLYGWYATSAEQFEPIMALDDISTANFLIFVSCNCLGDCTTKTRSCKKDNVKYIPACGGCHSILSKNNGVEVPFPASDQTKRLQIILVDSVNYGILNLVILNPYYLC